MYTMSTITYTEKTNYSAQDVFRRSVDDILKQNQSGDFQLNKAETRVVPFASVKAAEEVHAKLKGDARFSLISYTSPSQKLGTAVLNVFTSDSFELTNVLLGNLDNSRELSFYQRQELSESSKMFFKAFLKLLEKHTNHSGLFTALTLTDGRTDYRHVQSGAGEGLVLTAVIPYAIPSIGSGHFQIIIQVG